LLTQDRTVPSSPFALFAEGGPSDIAGEKTKREENKKSLVIVVDSNFRF
jgi:hypothetical protein